MRDCLPERVADTHKLLVAARNGDRAAFSALCEPYRERVWRIVATVTDRGADRDDLAQEAFVRAWSSLENYRGEATFVVWLCRIALNAAHDYRRSAWQRKILTGIPLWNGFSRTEPVAKSAQTVSEQGEERRRIHRAVADLGEKERVPIALIYFEGFTLAEVARLEKLPESTIRSRVQRGLKRLADNLRDLEPDMQDLLVDEPTVRGFPTKWGML